MRVHIFVLTPHANERETILGSKTHRATIRRSGLALVSRGPCTSAEQFEQRCDQDEDGFIPVTSDFALSGAWISFDKERERKVEAILMAARGQTSCGVCLGTVDSPHRGRGLTACCHPICPGCCKNWEDTSRRGVCPSCNTEPPTRAVVITDPPAFDPSAPTTTRARVGEWKAPKALPLSGGESGSKVELIVQMALHGDSFLVVTSSNSDAEDLAAHLRGMYNIDAARLPARAQVVVAEVDGVHEDFDDILLVNVPAKTTLLKLARHAKERLHLLFYSGFDGIDIPERRVLASVTKKSPKYHFLRYR